MIRLTRPPRDHSKVEVEFLEAMREHEVQSGRDFLTWNDVLEVVRTLRIKPSSVCQNA